MGTNKKIKIYFVFIFFLSLFASCNGAKEELKQIKQDMDSIKAMFSSERSTFNALASRSFKSFVKLACLHGVLEDGYCDEEDLVEESPDDLVADFVNEVIDQHLAFKDTILIDSYRIRFYYETDSMIILWAQAYPDRFNHAHWKFSLSKSSGNLELALWDRDDPHDCSPLPNFVREEDDTLIINTATMVITIPQLQKLKHYYREATAAGYDCNKCDRWLLLSFPNVTVSNK